MRTFIILLLLFCSSFLYAKEDLNVIWQKANKAYEHKDYESAAFYYEKIATTKPHETVVYYNLGNAYYKLNQIAPAILNYERALQVDPGNKEAADNLSIAQSRITNRLAIVPDIFFVRWWHAITAANHTGMWAIISLLIFSFLVGYGIIRKIKRSNSVLPVQLRAGIITLFILCVIFGFTSANNQTSPDKAVVMQNETPLYTSTQQTKPALYVPEGTTIKCGKELQGWVEVILPDGRNGWIRTDAITRI